MAITQQTQGERIDMAAQGAGGILEGLFNALGSGLRGLGRLRAGVDAHRIAPPATAEMSELFARAVCENSNSAMDWLYYAAQLTSPAERRYCVGRALQIDPESEVVRRELRRMGWR